MSKDKPDYEKLATLDEVDAEIHKHKELIVRKVKERGQLKSNRKDAMKGFNDELKEVEFQLDHNTEILDELNRHKKLIMAGGGPKMNLKSV